MFRSLVIIIATMAFFITQPCLGSEGVPICSPHTFLTEQFEPYNYQGNGQAKGIAIEFLKLMWHEMGEKEYPIQFLPWPRAYEMTRTRSGIVLFATIRTPERENLFKWVGPIALTKTYLIAPKDSPITIHSLNEAKGLTVGVVRDYASASMLKKHADLIRIDELRCSEMLIQKLLSGRIDLIAIEERYFHRTLKEMNLTHEDFKHVWLLNRYATHFALSKDTLDVEVKRYQEACDTVRQSLEYQQLLDRYFK